ncbi:hypothetical protein [Streptomyces sp. NPDC048106]|uniref:hypothetical protein n=1 Tax=Streptomyces sp. NPDC048106 TaxID=3155750 RepID=UPI003452F9E9
MTGTVVVHAEPPALRRAGKFGVVVDGVKVGQVRQGDTARFTVPAGPHTVQIATKDRTRSNTVTVNAVEGQDFLVTVRSTGLGIAFLFPVLAAVAVPGYYVIGAVLLTGALFHAVPGLLFRVRADGVPELRAAEAVLTSEETQGGMGLWWESDPVLAKRFRKDADS